MSPALFILAPSTSEMNWCVRSSDCSLASAIHLLVTAASYLTTLGGRMDEGGREGGTASFWPPD